MAGHACVQAARALLRQGMGGQADDGEVRPDGPNAPGGLEAVHHRHLQVHQHDVKGRGPRGSPRLRPSLDLNGLHGGGTILGKQHPGVLLFQDVSEQEAVDLHVLGRQHAQAM